MPSRQYDVIIIGGGPAGSTAATLLAMDGHSVLVLEKAKFPRDHVGESLLPFCYSLFERLGVLDQMRKMYVRKPGVRFLDADGNHSTPRGASAMSCTDPIFFRFTCRETFLMTCC